MKDSRSKYALENNDKLETEEYIYEIQRIIGFGGASIVYLANRIDKKNSNDIKKVAVKELFPKIDGLIRDDNGEIRYENYRKSSYGETLYDKYKKEFEREPEFINEIITYCPGVVNSYSFKKGIYLNDQQVDDNYYLFLEVFENNGKLLCDIIKKYKETFNCDRLNLIDALNLIKKILLSLDDFHNNPNQECKRFLHGDIKAENIYFKTSELRFNCDEDLHVENERISIDNLGIAAFLDLSTVREVTLDSEDNIYKTEEIEYDLIARSHNCAPEMVNGFEDTSSESKGGFSSIFDDWMSDEDEVNTVRLTRSCDVFSVGVILYEMIFDEEFLGPPDYHIDNHKFEYEDKNLIGCTSNVCIDVLNEILKKSLAFSLKERYLSAKEFLDDIYDLESTIKKKGFSKNILFAKTEEIMDSLGDSVLTKALNDDYILNYYTKKGQNGEIEGYLEDELKDENYLIIGQGGIGKSTVIRKYIKKILNDKSKIPIYINLENIRYNVKKQYKYNYLFYLIKDVYSLDGNKNVEQIIDDEFRKNTSRKEYVIILEDLHKIKGHLKDKIFGCINELLQNTCYTNVQIIATSRYEDESLKFKNTFEIKTLNDKIVDKYLRKHEIFDININVFNLIKIPIYLNLFIDSYSKDQSYSIANSAELIKNYLDYSFERYMNKINDEIILENGISYGKDLIVFIRDFIISKVAFYSYGEYSFTYKKIKNIIESSWPLVYQGEGYNQEVEFFGDRFKDYERNIFPNLDKQYENFYSTNYENVSEFRVKDIIEIFTKHLGLLKLDSKNNYVFCHDLYFEYMRDLYVFDKFKYVCEEGNIELLVKYIFKNKSICNCNNILKMFAEFIDFNYKEDIIFACEKIENAIIKYASEKPKTVFTLNNIVLMQNIVKYLYIYIFLTKDRDEIKKKILNKLENRSFAFVKNENLMVEQLYQLYLGVKQNVAFEKYYNEELDWMQMYEMRMGLLYGINIRSDINSQKMQIQYLESMKNNLESKDVGYLRGFTIKRISVYYDFRNNVAYATRTGRLWINEREFYNYINDSVTKTKRNLHIGSLKDLNITINYDGSNTTVELSFIGSEMEVKYLFSSITFEIKKQKKSKEKKVIDKIEPVDTKKNKFDKDKSLEELKVRKTDDSIGDNAFKEYRNLKEVCIENSVETIGKSAFEGCTNLRAIEIPSSVGKIGERAFKGCISLREVKISKSIKIIEASTFEKCRNLTGISIPNSVTTIGEGVFKGCTELKKVEILNSVNSIGNYAFEDCISLSEINIPNSVTTIGEGVFKGCTELKKVEILNPVNSIGDYAFEGCTSLSEINIPNSVTTIGREALKNCSNLEKVVISDNVRKINRGLFRGCTQLKEVFIPNNVVFIEKKAFYDCSNLKQVIISNPEIHIEEDAFKKCPNVCIYCGKNSYTEKYCIENNIKYKYFNFFSKLIKRILERD